MIQNLRERLEVMRSIAATLQIDDVTPMLTTMDSLASLPAAGRPMIDITPAAPNTDEKT